MARLKPKNGEEKPEEPISESYISIGLGLLVVVVVGILLYNYFTQRTKQQTAQPEVTQEATIAAQPGTTYTVQPGDTLWSVSEKAYGTGYNWVDIKEANNLATDELTAGQQLVLPEVTPKAVASSTPIAEMMASPEVTAGELPATGTGGAEPTPMPEQVSPPVTITGTTYTVVKGDTLWDIACRAYGDCYAWVKIAEANKLANPDLIHPGNVFTLPR